MSKASFRKDLIDFLVEASNKDENYYGYINPWLIAEVVSALRGTAPGDEEAELEGLSEWADEYWSW
jgi:hypothetical protein